MNRILLDSSENLDLLENTLECLFSSYSVKSLRTKEEFRVLANTPLFSCFKRKIQITLIETVQLGPRLMDEMDLFQFFLNRIEKKIRHKTRKPTSAFKNYLSKIPYSKVVGVYKSFTRYSPFSRLEEIIEEYCKYEDNKRAQLLAAN